MFVPFDQLPDHTRVWIYPSNRPFITEELSLIHKNYARSLFNSVYEEWDSFLDQTAINDRLFLNVETS